MKPVVVLGAGISGLTLGYRLQQRGREVLVLEAEERVGGSINSHQDDGFLVERGPNSLLTTEATDALGRDLGLTDQEVVADSSVLRYIVRYGRPIGLAPGPKAMFAPVLSWPAKFRVLGDLFLPSPKELEDESVAGFFARRFGGEVAHYLAGPFVSGVYAGDPERISVRSAFGKMWDAERRFRSGVIRGFRKRDQEILRETGRPRYKRKTASYRDGLRVLPESLAAKLGDALVRGCRISSVERIEPPTDGARWAVVAEDGRRFEAETLISTLPEYVAAKLLADLAPEASATLGEVRRVAVVTVCLAYPVSAFHEPPNGFGALIPRSEPYRILGCLYISSFLPDRAPAGWVALTAFIGGAFDPEAVTLSDEKVLNVVHSDVQRLLQIDGEPRLITMTRWPQAIPQYEMGHHLRVAAVEEALKPHEGLVVAGNWRGGVALADCVGSAEAIASQIAG